MIRRINEKDEMLFLQMANEFYHSDAVLHPIPEAYLVNIYREAMRSDAYVCIYIFEYEGNAAGYAIVTKTFSTEAGGLTLWIEDVYIRSPFRSRGLGSEFFQMLDEVFRGQVRRFRLEVEENNRRAVALYEKMGFQRLSYCQMIKDVP